MSKVHEVVAVPSIKVIGEQDGVVERDINARFRAFLAGTGYPCRAYLARVEYGNTGEYNVALLLRLRSGDEALVNAGLGKVFHGMFRSDQHLDIMFLSESDETNVRSLVTPFFSSIIGT